MKHSDKVFVWSNRLALPKDNPPLGYALNVDCNHPSLKERGLTLETLVQFGVGYCSSEPLKHRIAIPVHNTQGRLVGYAGLRPGNPKNKQAKYKFVTDGYLGNELFNLNRVQHERHPDPVILVTDFFDVLHLWQLGWWNVIALMGQELETGQLARLLHHFPAQRFIALFDETHYGRAARKNMLRLAARAFVHIPQFRWEGRRVESLTATELEEL